MKNFLKYTLATIVGIMIVHVILFFIFIGFIGAIASFSEKTVTVKNNSILTIKLEGEILDRTSDNPLDNIDFLSFTPKKNLGLNKILASIQKAAKDSRIQGIYLDLTEIQGNFGALAFTQEIRNALQKFKESGKFIIAYGDSYLQLFEPGIFPKKLLSGYRCRQNLCKPRNTFVVNRNEQ